MSDRVTVVVATRDRWPDLQTSLPRHEGPVILVDNASTDGTPDLVAAAFPHVQVIRLQRNLAAVARNVGVDAATTPYVAFADDDSWWAPGALDRAAEILDRHPRIGLIAGRVLVHADERLDPVCAQMSASPLGRRADLPGPSVLGAVACGSIVRRAAYLEAGGFDPVVGFPGEEERLALDLAAYGWDLVYVDELVAHHHPSSTRPPDVSRRAASTRSALLTTLMRRPWPVVGAHWRAALLGDRASRLGLARATLALPRALPRRRVLPDGVEKDRRLLERV